MSARIAAHCILVIALALCCAPARAQLGAASPATERPSHGWLVLPADEQGFTLWHVPPRAGAASGSGGPGEAADSRAPGAPSGTLRIVTRLAQRPEALAAWGAEAWLLTPARKAASGAEMLRSIYRVGVRHSPLGAGWQYVDGGRLQTERPLPGAGALLDVAGARSGLHALLAGDGGDAHQLWRLDPSGWTPLEIPPAAAAPPAGAIGLVALRDGIGLWAADEAGALTLWTGRAASSPDAELNPGRAAAPAALVEWSPTALAPVEAASGESREGARLWSIGGRIIITDWPAAATLRVRDLSGSRPAQVALLDGLDPGAAVCGLDGSRRIIVSWRDPEAESPKAPWNPRRMIEISTDDGAALYDGLASSPGPVSPAEFRLLAITLVLVSAAALVFIVRGDERRAIMLPDGAALAPARLRLAAGAVDASLAWLLASGLAGLGGGLLGDLLGGLAIAPDGVGGGWGFPGGGGGGAVGVGASLDFAPLVGTVIVGCALSTLSEWIFGRTPGKWLARCAVVSVRPADHRPGMLVRPRLWQALVRNVIKYPLAPIALLGLATPDLRHRGDTLGITAVVIALPPVEPEPEAPDA